MRDAGLHLIDEKTNSLSEFRRSEIDDDDRHLLLIETAKALSVKAFEGRSRLQKIDRL